jgi:TolB protein
VVNEINEGKIRNFQPHEGVVALGWSPEHDRLAYISPEELRLSFYGPLKLIDLEDDTQRVLTDEVVFAFFWSPDGDKIAYLTLASFEEGETTNIIKFDLSVVNVVNNEVSKIVQFQPSTVFIDQLMPFFDNYAQSHRIWSPTSDALVLPMINGEGESQIVVVPIDGGELRTIADGVSAFWSYK